MKRKWLTVGIILVFVGIAYAPAIAQNIEKQSISRGNWLYVGGSGPGNYSRIQDAIDNASDGDTVFVYDDSSPYHENLVIFNKISVIGENANTTIIDGGDLFSVVFIGGDFGETGRFHFSNFTIQNSSYGLRISSSKGFSVTRNIFVNNPVIDNLINMEDSNNTYIMNNTITDNDGGIFLRNSDNNTISFNRIENNGDTSEPWMIYGIGLLDSCNNTIANNCIVHNDGSGIASFSAQREIELKNFIQNNIISFNSRYGISLSHFSSNSRVTGNNISFNDAGGIYLWNNNNVTIDNNILINNNQSGIYAWENVNNLFIVNNRIIGNNPETGTGLTMRFSAHNTISKNIIRNYDCGVYLSGVSDCTISYNTIQNNSIRYGMYLSSSQNNNITRNNLIGNKKTNVYFEGSLFAGRNHLDQNYWGRPKVLPKIITGWAVLNDWSIPWFNIDWHPARKPYDIPGVK